MQIEFRKIPHTVSEVLIQENDLACEVRFQKETTSLVKAEIYIRGVAPVDCDRCGVAFDLSIEERINLKLSDGLCEDEDLDIVECHDHVVDFDEIVKSEIASIISDYHYCEKCNEVIEGE